MHMFELAGAGPEFKAYGPALPDPCMPALIPLLSSLCVGWGGAARRGASLTFFVRTSCGMAQELTQS